MPSNATLLITMAFFYTDLMGGNGIESTENYHTIGQCQQEASQIQKYHGIYQVCHRLTAQ